MTSSTELEEEEEETVVREVNAVETDSAEWIVVEGMRRIVVLLTLEAAACIVRQGTLFDPHLSISLPSVAV